MSKRTRARISQCMIVKNEEKNIEKALSWGKGVVSEQIVVDTGSTDRTVELAEKMGAKVYHFECGRVFFRRGCKETFILYPAAQRYEI